jgi:excisionase family DNA binding protein
MENKSKNSLCKLNLKDVTQDTQNCSVTIEWMTSEEVANYLRVSIKTLRNWTSNGQIPFHKIGKLNRFRKDEIERLILSQKRGRSCQ